MGNNQANSDIFKSQHELEEEFKNEPNNTLLVKTHTWSKDSHGLYDYKGENTFVEQKMKIYKSGVILRESEQITFNEEKNSEQLINKDQLSQNSLLNIMQLNNQTYRVEQSQGNKLNGCQHNEQNDHQIWLIVRSLKNIKGGKNGCLLKEQDYIKLGRVRFRIKEVFASNQNSEQQQQKQASVFEQYNNKITSNNNIKKVQTQGTVPDDDNAQNSDGETREEGKACRFCLSDTATLEDPLLSPCNCSGSVKYVHIRCLKQWLQNKITTKSSNFSTAYNWKSLQCELCSYQYPQQINQNGRSYPTFDIKKPDGPYIILEILQKDKNQSKGIHVLNFSQNKDTIKIGRGSDSDMKVQDISVSRGHAQIKFYKGNFYLEDLDSKFGTLALIKNHIDLSNNTNKIAIQVNRTVFSFYMKQFSNNFIPCGQKQKKVKDFILNPPAEIDGQQVNKQKSSVLKQDDVKTKVNEENMYRKNNNLRNNDDIFGEIGEIQPLDIEEEKKDQELNIQIMKSKQHRPNNLQYSNLCQSQKQLQIQTEHDHQMFDDDNNNINKIQDSNINFNDNEDIQIKSKNGDNNSNNKNLFVDHQNNLGGLKLTSFSNNNSEKKVGIIQFEEDEEFEESVNGENMNRMANLQMHSNNLNQKEESEPQSRQLIHLTQNNLD